MFSNLSDTRPWATGYYIPAVEGASAYGPRPRLLLGDEQASDLARTRKTLRRNARRLSAWHRHLVLTEQHAGLIKAKVESIIEDATVRRLIQKHVDASVDLALDIVRDLCVVWKHDAQRTIKKAKKSEQEAFLQLVKESKFLAFAKAWNRQAFYEGPTTIVPVVRAERLTWDILLPHAYDVVADEDDIWGPPVAAVWDAYKPPFSSDLPVERQPKADSVILDAETWSYVSTKKGEESIARESHGLDVFPGSTLRFDDIGHGDWWGNHYPHQRLQDVTLKLGFIVALLDYVRKSMNRKMMTAVGDIEGIPKGQVLAAETPLEAYTQSPEQIAIQALDLDVDPESFIKHATWHMQLVARSYGGQVVASVGSASLLEADVQFSHDVLTEIRNEQIPHAREFEIDLWTKAVGIAKANGHPLADDLPDPEKVREGLQIEFPKLARSFANTDEEIKYWDFSLKNGRAAYGDLMRPEMPLATDEERDEAVLKNVERQVPVVEAFTKRDLSQDPAAREDASLKTPAQQFGAKGPAVRDGKEPPPDEEPEEEA